MNRWVQRDRAWGEPALKARKQGGSPRPKLNRQQLAQTTRLVRDHAPDQLELPYALWTREAVGQLIQQQWGVRLSQQAVGNYLRAWGLSPQKPTKRAREQCPLRPPKLDGAPVPALHRRAQREGAPIHAW
ncbi:MAG: hypothetical protein BRC54_07400 [Cyanobacteria bacterium SW_7_48_12]|nr:MAG: hypothetical protein BRC54_07400 [Cyanobacteria bacterium SW_7_48_12]